MMKQSPRISRLTVLLLMVICFQLQACHSTKKSARTAMKQKELISELRTDWLHYKIFRLPDTLKRAKGKEVVQLSIRVLNTMDDTSPLRKLCTDLEQYNIRYEYLLNGAKNEVYLQSPKGISYPVSYSFENNYNAVPFETINVGYHINRLEKGTRLVYVDRVFAQDTLYFPVR